MPVINVHPILVHFPIALLSIYSILELVQLLPVWKNFLRQPYWFYVKAVLVIVGSLSTIPTMLAGIIAKPLFEDAIQVVNVHETFAITTSIIFLFLGMLYVVIWMKKQIKKSSVAFLLRLQKIIFLYHIEKILALIGLITITITGALGGIIAFGPGTDPLAHFVYILFFH